MVQMKSTGYPAFAAPRGRGHHVVIGDTERDITCDARQRTKVQ